MVKNILFLVRKGLFTIREEGFLTTFRKTKGFFINKTSQNDIFNGKSYSEWIEEIEPALFQHAKQLKDLSYQPKVSLLIPVYNAKPEFLRKCFESVVHQTYSNWEMCVVDDCSTQYRKEIISILEEYKTKYPEKFLFKLSAQNQHISLNTNECAKLSTGEYLQLLDNDDTLSPSALQEYVFALNEKQNIDIIYGDEDYIDEKDMRKDPFFRPVWSPDYLLTTMYFPHYLIKKSIFEKLGGMRKGYEGSQDWDLALRALDLKPYIHHIPKILYHWRISSTSTAGSLDNKSYVVKAQEKALTDYIERNKLEAKIEKGIWVGSYMLRYKHNNPRVSIIIPNKDQKELLQKCIDSLFKVNAYLNIEIIIVENNSKEQKTFDYYQELEKKENCTVVYYKGKEFNYSKVNNLGVKHAKGKLLLFLNNDIECLSPDSIEFMVENVLRADIGAVGGKLLYPNRTVQHAGVDLDPQTLIPFHQYSGKNELFHGGFGSPVNSIRNPKAVTAACLMIEKKKFEVVGGFNEDYIIAYQDIDLNFSLQKLNFRTLYHPKSLWMHYESITRKTNTVNLHQVKDFKLFSKRYERLFKK